MPHVSKIHTEKSLDFSEEALSFVNDYWSILHNFTTIPVSVWRGDGRKAC